jgi:large repetitive protein
MRPKLKGDNMLRISDNLLKIIIIQCLITIAFSSISYAESGAISGTVIKSDNTTPISGAHVYALTFDNQVTGGMAITDANGKYTINYLEGGTYKVEASFNGYVISKKENISVALNKITPNVNFILIKGASISGIIREKNTSNLIADADVYVSTENYVTIDSSKSQSNGEYSLNGLLKGFYTVSVQATGYVKSSVSGIKIDEGTNLGGIDFNLEKGGSMSGLVVRSDGGNPVPEARVVASGSTGSKSVSSSSDGTFEITGLEEGIYEVSVFADGFYLQTKDNIEIINNVNTSNVNFSLSVGGAISGKVVNSSNGNEVVEGAVLTAGQLDGEGVGSCESNNNGEYIIEQLPPGNYDVSVYASGLTYIYISNIQVESSVATTNIDFSLSSENGAISGTITDSGGNPISGAAIIAEAQDIDGSYCSYKLGVSQNDGTYIIDFLPPSENYSVTASAEGSNDATLLGISVRNSEITGSVNFTLITNP